MSLAGIRDAIKTALETISGLKAFDTAPESISQLPAAYVLPKSGNYDFTVGGSMEHHFEIVLLVQRGGTIAEAQDAIDGYCSETGTNSIKVAVDAAALGANASAIRVEGYRDYGGFEYAGQTYLGAKFDVTAVT